MKSQACSGVRGQSKHGPQTFSWARGGFSLSTNGPHLEDIEHWGNPENHNTCVMESLIEGHFLS